MSPINTMPYQSQSPILFIIFNRSDTALKVMDEIRKAKPARLYITADAFRPERPEEEGLCDETKTSIMAAIDWECEVKTLFRTQNLGPKEAIASAIDWFFEHEDEGIILEHDCLPAKSFFYFCDTLLEKYRNDQRIWLISGCNFQKGKKWGSGTYYFSNLTHAWGWATWKSSWNEYDKDLSRYEASDIRVQLEKIFNNSMVVDQWVYLFEQTKCGNIDTWDYQVAFAHMFNQSVTIIPNVNLVSNIGFGEKAENTTDINSMFANIPLEEITEIKHPKYLLPEKEADMNLLMEDFKIEEKLRFIKRHNLKRRRFKRWLKSLFSPKN